MPLLLDHTGVFMLQKVLHKMGAESPIFNRSSQSLHTLKATSFHWCVSEGTFYLLLCAPYSLIGPEEEFLL